MGDFGKTSLLVAVVLAIVVCALNAAHAAVKSVSPDQPDYRPQKPLYEAERVVPCLDHRDPVNLSEYYLEAADGSRIVIGYEAIRKRC